jgi:hypothetical protein
LIENETHEFLSLSKPIEKKEDVIAKPEDCIAKQEDNI